MGSGGHNRKPRQRKIIEGSFRKDRNPESEPEPPVITDIPKPPPGMNRWARKMWKRLAPILKDTGVLTEADLETFRLCCATYGEYEEARQLIYRPVNPLTGKRVRRTLEQYFSGLDPWIDVEKLEAKDFLRLRRNSQTMPELATMNNAASRYRAYMTEFGLSAVARNRINVPKPTKTADPMEAMLEGKG